MSDDQNEFESATEFWDENVTAVTIAVAMVMKMRGELHKPIEGSIADKFLDRYAYALAHAFEKPETVDPLARNLVGMAEAAERRDALLLLTELRNLEKIIDFKIMPEE